MLRFYPAVFRDHAVIISWPSGQNPASPPRANQQAAYVSLRHVEQWERDGWRPNADASSGGASLKGMTVLDLSAGTG